MIYKIIVDKQPMTNPSADKKEYEIDIAPLYFKHDVYDSLVITHDEDYVMRRLELQDYNVLVELDPPVKEPLTDINIELFEGENYIYLYDMVGNKIVAQYLIKNEFNELYVLESTMNSAITQSANAIELYVQQNYETIDHASSEYARIDLNAQGITTEVSKKVGKTEVISSINQSAEAVTINANKININGTVSANGNFKVDVNGNMQCSNANVSGTITSNNATITNGEITLYGGTSSNPKFSIRKQNSQEWVYLTPNEFQVGDPAGAQMTFNSLGQFNARGFYGNDLKGFGIQPNTNSATMNMADFYVLGTMHAYQYYYDSLESIKKNINKFDKKALDIINKSEVYEYNYKTEEDKKKKTIGFVIGDEGNNYNTPEEVVSDDGKGINSYSAIGILWKAIQEQQQQIEELKSRIEKLEKGDK